MVDGGIESGLDFVAVRDDAYSFENLRIQFLSGRTVTHNMKFFCPVLSRQEGAGGVTSGRGGPLRRWVWFAKFLYKKTLCHS
jgi:hypothetical protein